MRGKKFSPEQIIRIIKESELGVKNIDICRKYGISEQTFYNWKNKYGNMNVRNRGRSSIYKLTAGLKNDRRRYREHLLHLMFISECIMISKGPQLFCCWVVREPGISISELSRKPELHLAGISQSAMNSGMIPEDNYK